MKGKNMTRTKLATIATCFVFVACLVSGFLLSGCAAPVLEIGNDSDKEFIATTNETGQAITEVALKTESEEAFGENLAQSEEWANGEIAHIHLTQAQLDSPESTEVDPNQAAVPSNLYVLRIKTSDGMEYELHQLDLSDIKDASICIEGDVAYLEYTSINTGELVNTLDDEIAYRESKAAEEAARIEAELQAAEQAQAEQASKSGSKGSESSSSKNSSSNSSSSPTTKKPSSNGSSSGSSGSSGSSSSDEDVCVDDLIFND